MLVLPGLVLKVNSLKKSERKYRKKVSNNISQSAKFQLFIQKKLQYPSRLWAYLLYYVNFSTFFKLKFFHHHKKFGFYEIQNHSFQTYGLWILVGTQEVEGRTTRVECPIFSQELYDVKWSCFWLHKKSTNNNFYTIVGYYGTFEEHDGPLINLMYIAVCISFLG